MQNEARNKQFGCGKIASHGDVINQREPRQSFYVNVMRMRRERINQKYQRIDLPFGNERANLLIPAQRAGLEALDGQFRATLHNTCARRASGDQLA